MKKMTTLVMAAVAALSMTSVAQELPKLSPVQTANATSNFQFKRINRADALAHEDPISEQPAGEYYEMYKASSAFYPIWGYVYNKDLDGSVGKFVVVTMVTTTSVPPSRPS